MKEKFEKYVKTARVLPLQGCLHHLCRQVKTTGDRRTINTTSAPNPPNRKYDLFLRVIRMVGPFQLSISPPKCKGAARVKTKRRV